ncbi:hypothetical protein [Zooshikella sp. RANM57]|uniref:hypothetical protein n=1 Tax=Zooshikella sp. RANM57 TaxID=3425863 RepID=UPI003D6DFEF2
MYIHLSFHNKVEKSFTWLHKASPMPAEHAVNPSLEARLPHPCGKRFYSHQPDFAKAAPIESNDLDIEKV